jgi:DNA-binding winged helix-turn-helix (wHTH) protein
MPNQPQTYRFGEYTLETSEHRLLRNSAEVALRPKVGYVFIAEVQRARSTRSCGLDTG